MLGRGRRLLGRLFLVDQHDPGTGKVTACPDPEISSDLVLVARSRGTSVEISNEMQRGRGVRRARTCSPPNPPKPLTERLHHSRFSSATRFDESAGNCPTAAAAAIPRKAAGSGFATQTIPSQTKQNKAKWLGFRQNRDFSMCYGDPKIQNLVLSQVVPRVSQRVPSLFVLPNRSQGQGRSGQQLDVCEFDFSRKILTHFLFATGLIRSKRVMNHDGQRPET